MFLKRIGMTLCMLASLVSAQIIQESDDSGSQIGKWYKFFGVEAGIGSLDVVPAYFATFNPRGLGTSNYLNALGISANLGILGGWQKYTKEGIGMRNILGYRVSYVNKFHKGTDDTSFLWNGDYRNAKGKKMMTYSFYYALDGIFDFVTYGDKHFGATLGFSTSIFNLNTSNEFLGMAFLFFISVRTGLYYQSGSNIIDLGLSIPAIGYGAIFGDIAYNHTAMLSYRHLF